jgi:hypothetical protein
MTANTQAFNVKTATTELLGFATRQGDSLTKKAKPLADAISDAPESDRSALAHQAFLAARGEVVAAKISNAKDRARALSKAWNRVVDAIRYHLQKADLSVRFPNLASGEGETVVQTTADAGIERKAQKALREEADAQALEAFQAERAQAELDALRAMSPDNLTAQIVAMLDAWSDDQAMRTAVVAAVHTAVCPKTDLLSARFDPALA